MSEKNKNLSIYQISRYSIVVNALLKKHSTKIK